MRAKTNKAMMGCWKSREFWKKSIPLLVYFAVSAIYLVIPMGFAPDSITYLSGAFGLLEGAGWSMQAVFRGPFIPLLILPFFLVFGKTVLAVKLCWFLLYSIFYFVVYQLLKKLGLFEGRWKAAIWVLFVFALLLNPTVLTYSHLCLTEFPAMVVFSVYLLVLVGEYCKSHGSLLLYTSKAAIALCGFAILMYSVKQAMFPSVFAVFSLFELACLIKKFQWAKIASFIVVVAVALAGLFGYVTLWGRTLQGESIEGDSISSFSATFLIDGLRYFRIEERGVYGVPVQIDEMEYDYQTVTESFEHNFSGSISDTLNFWQECFKRNCMKVIKGYADNYKIVAGTKEPIGLTGTQRAYSAVCKETRFFWAQETKLWCEAFRYIKWDENVNQMSLTDPMLEGGPSALTFPLAQAVCRVLFNRYYNALGYFQYGAFAHFALFISLAGVAFFWKYRKNAEKGKRSALCMICMGSAFMEITFLAVTAQCIDRYGFPMTICCFLTVVCLARSVIDAIERGAAGKQREDRIMRR